MRLVVESPAQRGVFVFSASLLAAATGGRKGPEGGRIAPKLPQTRHILVTMAVPTLTADEVLRIHYVLCADFADEPDPIGYGGVKSMAMLESAVGRQHAGFGPFRKYSDPVSNAATLPFGIRNDHPFHNGNKRTALVSMLAHLEKNHFALKDDVRQSALYDLMLSLANHELDDGVGFAAGAQPDAATPFRR
jgi:prophage maintenance system killer protein